MTLEIIFILVGQYSLTGTKDVAFVICSSIAVMIHFHIVGTNLGIAPDSDVTIATSLVCQRIRHTYFYARMCCHKCRIIYVSLFDNVIFTHRGNLAAAIDTLSYLGTGLDGDKGVAAHQGSVAVLLHAFAATEYVTLDFGSTRFILSDRKSDSHHAIPFHTANLATAIDGAFNRAVADADSRSFACSVNRHFLCYIYRSIVGSINAHHGFRTLESTSNTGILCGTLAATEHITLDGHALVIYASEINAFVFYYILRIIIIFFLSTDVHVCVSCYVSQVAATIDIASDVGALHGHSLTRRHQVYSCLCADIHRSVAIDSSLVAAAIDIANRAQLIRIIGGGRNSSRSRNCGIPRETVCIRSRNHVDVHRRVGIHGCANTVAAAEHLADAGTRGDVHHRIVVNRSHVFSFSCIYSPFVGRPIVCFHGLAPIGCRCSWHERQLSISQDRFLTRSTYATGIFTFSSRCLYIISIS